MKIVEKPGKDAETLKTILKNLDGKVGKVGWFPSAKYEDGTPVAYVAAIQEFGSPANNIPPRSFMRTTIAEKEQGWAQIAENEAKKIVNGKQTTENAVTILVLKAAGDVRKKISTIYTPKLKESTIEARKRKRADKKTTGSLTKPLVDTGYLLGTLDTSVENKK